MGHSWIVKFSVSFLALAVVFTALPSPVRAAATEPLAREISCTNSESQEGFPTSIRFRVVNPDEVEARGGDVKGRESSKTILKRTEIASQPKVAVFSVAGSLGISGDARMIVTKDALKFGEVGTMLIVNQTIRETAIYQCRKI